MGFFNKMLVNGLLGNGYKCPNLGCNGMMTYNEDEEILICPVCGLEMDYDQYGFTDEEYEDLYPTKEEVCGYSDDEENQDEDDGETYDEVYGELHLDDD